MKQFFAIFPPFKLAINTASMVAAAAICVVGRCHAQIAGDLDASFGISGVVTTDLRGGLWRTFTTCMALQSDQKILIGGNRNNEMGQSEMTLTRYTPDGHLDTSFGGGDGILTGQSGISNATFWSIVQQPDGKILAVGETSNSSAFDTALALWRYHPDGTPDLDFGGGNGRKELDWSSEGRDTLSCVLLQPDGKIVGAGSVTEGGLEKPAVTRFLGNGQLDPAFGAGGVVVFNSAPEAGMAASAARQSDGKLLVTGRVGSPFESSFWLARYNQNGTPDTSFGSGGKVILSEYREGLQITLQPDHMILVTGSVSDGASFVARFLDDGRLDVAFGEGNGVALISPVGPNADFAFTFQPRCLLQFDGGLLIAVGQGVFLETGAEQEMQLIKFNAAGVLDTTFGPPHGWVIRNPAATAVDGGNYFEFVDAVAQPGGGIVVAGDYSPFDETVLGQMAARFHSGSTNLDPLKQWRQLHFQTTENSGSAANSSDPDGDGLDNILEFALGGEPNPANPDWNSAGLRPTLAPTDRNHLMFEFNRMDLAASQPGMLFIPQYSSDAVVWTAAFDGSNGITISEVNDPQVAGVDKVTVRLPMALGNGRQLFARLKVMIP